MLEEVSLLYVYTVPHMHENLCIQYMLYEPLTNWYIHQKATSVGCTAYQVCVYIYVHVRMYVFVLYLLYVLCATIPHTVCVWGGGGGGLCVFFSSVS